MSIYLIPFKHNEEVNHALEKLGYSIEEVDEGMFNVKKHADSNNNNESDTGERGCDYTII